MNIRFIYVFNICQVCFEYMFYFPWLLKVGTRSVREQQPFANVSKPKRPFERQDKTNQNKHTESKKG